MAINSRFMQDDEFNIRGLGEQPTDPMENAQLSDLITKTPELSDVLPPKDQQAQQDQDSTPLVADTGNQPPKLPETPLTPLQKLESLMDEYRSDEKSLAEARKRDRMLKLGGAIGDSLATIINAQSQKSAKIPGVQVQQGAGLDKIADMFSTAPEIASDLKGRREALLAQYKQLAEAEKDKELLGLRKRQVSAYETQVKKQGERQEKAEVDQAKKEAEKLSVGEETLDREFAKEYKNWTTKGKAEYEENSKILKDAINQLKTGKVSTGTTEGAGSRIPGVRTKTRELETRVRKALNGMLRATLGPQFTQEEGERIFQQTFDPFADPKENVKNMQTELNKLEKQKTLIEDQGGYFKQKSTLRGYSIPETLEKTEETEEKNPDVQDYADQYFKGDYNKAFQFLKNRGDI